MSMKDMACPDAGGQYKPAATDQQTTLHAALALPRQTETMSRLTIHVPQAAGDYLVSGVAGDRLAAIAQAGRICHPPWLVIKSTLKM
jgi:hypothetical protein